MREELPAGRAVMQELSSRVGFAAGCGYDGLVAAGVVAARVAHVPGSALAAGGDGRPGNWLGWRMGSWSANGSIWIMDHHDQSRCMGSTRARDHMADSWHFCHTECWN